MINQKEVGRKVWARGNYYELVGWDKTRVYCMRLDENMERIVGNSMIEAFAYNAVEDIVTDMFKIGDTVETSYNGPFRGRVVGFELAENRAVCKSIKFMYRSDTKVRYSYKPHEIKKVELPPTQINVRGAAITIDGNTVIIRGTVI